MVGQPRDARVHPGAPALPAMSVAPMGAQRTDPGSRGCEALQDLAHVGRDLWR